MKLKEGNQQNQKKSRVILVRLLIVLVIAMSGYIGYIKLTPQNYFNTTLYKEEEISNLVIKLSDKDNTSYVKVSLVLSYDSRYKDISKSLPIIKDTCIGFFSSKNSEELTSENLDSIKQQLVRELNSKLEKDIINRIYFIDLIIQ